MFRRAGISGDFYSDHASSEKRIFRNLLVSLVIMACGHLLVPRQMYSFLAWGVYAVFTSGAAFVSLLTVNYICEPEEFKVVVQRVKNLKG